MLPVTLLALSSAAVTQNISYKMGGDCSSCPSCQCIDIYHAAKPSSPFVLLFHGGLWYSGSRSEISEVCENVVSQSKGAIGCGTADYKYSQDLGGCCHGCNETYRAQAMEYIEAYNFVSNNLPEVDPARVYMGGHRPPQGIIGVEGIYNATLWDIYDDQRFKGQFTCQNRQAFGNFPGKGWEDGSPTFTASSGVHPSAPYFLIHSPGDDWVQQQQASQLFSNLKNSKFEHKLDVAGRCVSGQHPDVLKGKSAVTLAKCVTDFVEAQEEATL